MTNEKILSICSELPGGQVVDIVEHENGIAFNRRRRAGNDNHILDLYVLGYAENYPEGVYDVVGNEIT